MRYSLEQFGAKKNFDALQEMQGAIKERQTVGVMPRKGASCEF